MIPSNNIRDYPNAVKLANEMFSEINERSPYPERSTSKLTVVKYYYIDGSHFVAEFDYRGTVRSMSIEFGSRGRLSGLPSREDPPADSILHWMKKKGINTARHRRSRVTGRYIKSYNLRQVAYAIAHHIGDVGTKPKGWGREMAEKIFRDYEARFNDAFAADFELQLQKEHPELFEN